ncbi:MAG: helicase, partial [Hyphomicrobium sp.]
VETGPTAVAEASRGEGRADRPFRGRRPDQGGGSRGPGGPVRGPSGPATQARSGDRPGGGGRDHGNDRNRDRERGGRPGGDKRREDRRPVEVISSAPPRKSGADPDSPFAKLMALREAMEKQAKDQSSS